MRPASGHQPGAVSHTDVCRSGVDRHWDRVKRRHSTREQRHHYGCHCGCHLHLPGCSVHARHVYADQPRRWTDDASHRGLDRSREDRPMIWNERGLTLAEILVAVAILGIGLVGLAVVVPIASYGVQEGSQLSTATFLAEQRLEQIRNAPWTGTPANDCVGTGANAPVVPAGVTCT